MFRFYLSTLLCFCVFSGSVLGLLLTPAPWRLWISFPLPKSDTQYPGPSLAFSSDGRLLAALHADRVHLFNVPDRTRMWEVAVRPAGNTKSNIRIRFTNDDVFIQIEQTNLETSDERWGLTRSFAYLHVGSPEILSPFAHPYATNHFPYATSHFVIERFETSARSITSPRKDETASYNMVGTGVEIVNIRPDRNDAPRVQRLSASSPIYAAAYSPDNQFLTLRQSDCVAVYRPPYSRYDRQYFSEPLLWIAIVSFLTLCAIIDRWRYASMPHNTEKSTGNTDPHAEPLNP